MITSLEQLKQFSMGVEVELPPFGEGMPFVARLRRPSMLEMLRDGHIPNSLLVTADALFNGRPSVPEAQDSLHMTKVFDVLEIMCRECLSEPTYDEIQEAGIKLTDEQVMAIFNYAQAGVEALKPFRGKSEDSGTDQHVTSIQPEALATTGD